MELESGIAGLKTQVPQNGAYRVEEDRTVEVNSAVARGQRPVWNEQSF